MNLLNRIEITQEHARTFNDEGALRIKKFLSPEGIETVREMVENDLAAGGAGSTVPGDSKQARPAEDEFKRRKYNVGNQQGPAPGSETRIARRR